MDRRAAEQCWRIGLAGLSDPVVDLLDVARAKSVALNGQWRSQRDRQAGFFFHFPHGGHRQRLVEFSLTFGPRPVVVARPMDQQDLYVIGINDVTEGGVAVRLRKSPHQCTGGSD